MVPMQNNNERFSIHLFYNFINLDFYTQSCLQMYVEDASRTTNIY